MIAAISHPAVQNGAAGSRKAVRCTNCARFQYRQLAHRNEAMPRESGSNREGKEERCAAIHIHQGVYSSSWGCIATVDTEEMEREAGGRKQC